MNDVKKNIIVAVTGASGSIYARLLIDELISFKIKGDVTNVDVVFSNNAKEVWKHELVGAPSAPTGTKVYNNDDFNAPFASGSAKYDVMIICPCSVGTMGRIANGLSDTLITRAADVMLKERRRLILAIRETPLNLIHINNMHLLTQAGAIITPASPSFYSKPNSINELAMTVVDRLLQLAEIKKDTYTWNGVNS